MNKLSKNILCLIALKLNEYDIASLSNTCKRMPEVISINEIFRRINNRASQFFASFETFCTSF